MLTAAAYSRALRAAAQKSRETPNQGKSQSSASSEKQTARNAQSGSQTQH